ncbi:MAG TPA: hypothetical protein DCZ94_09105 [Lentisphaeria bacterium]|nr:MAG: hypothetical protein A2X48_18535 [Lentisphaerae bacterium GWF2_49_21]HBC87098.1 hypothetical protein [Lentisphaeria bacterium]
MKRFIFYRIIFFTIAALLSFNLAAKDIYVDPVKGDDKSSGLAAEPQAGGNGPVKTLSQGIKIVKAGDTLHLAEAIFHETLQLNDTAGEPGRPIVIDGHGATITGCDPLRLDGWSEVSPGLYKSEKFLSELQESDNAAKIMRVFFLIDGKMQHMGRTSKGKKTPFKKPEDLQTGEWTVDETSNAFYLKVSGKLEDAKIEAPYRRNGVGIFGRKTPVAHIVIRNLNCIHVLNDGFNLHGKCNDVVFENISAYENGDDGYSAHETCESTINGYRASGNSTGIANAYESVNKVSNIMLEGNLGYEFLAGHSSTWEIRNMVVVADCPEPFMVGYGKQEENLHSTVKMENVQIYAPGKSNFQLKVKKYTVLEARNVTSVGVPWLIEGSAKVADSIISAPTLECTADGKWESDKNNYYLSSLTFKGKKYTAADFQSYKDEARTDHNSKFQPYVKEDAGKLINAKESSSIGANISDMKIPVMDKSDPFKLQ